LADRFESTESPSQKLAVEGKEHREKISFSVKSATRQPIMSLAQRVADVDHASGNIAMLAKKQKLHQPYDTRIGQSGGVALSDRGDLSGMGKPLAALPDRIPWRQARNHGTMRRHCPHAFSMLSVEQAAI
jgi:hypothetical protein